MLPAVPRGNIHVGLAWRRLPRGGGDQVSAETEGLATGQQQIVEIEFVSQLGEVFVARSEGRWHCGVKLVGEGPAEEGSIQGDGSQGTAYECYEYLSHLLKHDILFRDGVDDDPGPVLGLDLEPEIQEEAGEFLPSDTPEEGQSPVGEEAEGKPPPEPKRKSGRRKPGA